MKDLERDILTKIPLFSSLPEKDRVELGEFLLSSAVTVPPNCIIAERGTPMDELLVLLDGTAHAEIISGDGQAMIVESFRGPDIIATAMLFAPQPHFPVTLIADSGCTCAKFPRERLLDLSQKHRSVLNALLADTGRRAAFLTSRLRLAQFASLRQRIAVYLTELRRKRDKNGLEYVHVSHSRQELADMFGVARPSLSREIGRMCDEGLIFVSGSTVQIIDDTTLEALVSGCE
jgi:CRP-like cAMP-binding protein